MHREPPDRSGTVAVKDLVRRRLDPDDRWNLALVQRAEVWDQVRMRHLLDSMLAGYPIGAILLCRVAGDSRVIRVEDGARHVETASADAWQLLDGQQRINAFFSMLTDQGRYGRFYLHMTMRREHPGPVHARKSKDRALTYIAWRPGDSDAPFEDRGLHIDLSRWAAWTDRSDLPDPASIEVANVEVLLRDLDPEFAGPLAPDAAEVAADRMRRLVKAWTERSIPVLRSEVADPMDVLEIFTRINLGGVQVGGADVYFAAVKTFWPEAESSLDRMATAARFLRDRMGALRFVSRIASRGLGQGDLLPLGVDRLTGRNGQPLVVAMQEITKADASILARVEQFASWMRHTSRLGFALEVVAPELWDEVLAWAANCERSDGEWYAASLDSIESYLVGASLFHYVQVMGGRYRRAALLEAMAAGSEDEPFPLDQIIAVARSGSGLRGTRQAVLGLANPDDRQRIADQSGKLLTCLAQRIPYRPERDFDWDHIFPQAQASRMWTPGRGRRRHHPYRHLVNSAGNLWALDFSANRSLQAEVGESKFERLRRWATEPDQGVPVWPRERWSLSDDEIARFIEVDRLLTDDANSVERGMRMFRSLVAGRTARLLGDALERFPRVRLFAADAEVNADDPTTVHEFHDALGLARPTSAQLVARGPDRNGSETLNLGPDWADRIGWLKAVVREVTKRLQPDPSARALHAKAWSGSDYARWIRMGEPHPDTYMLFGIASVLAGEGTPIWAQVNSGTGGWEVIEARLGASEIADRVRWETGRTGREHTRAWIPVDAPAHMDWEQLVDHLVAQGRRIEEVIMTPSLQA